MSVNAPLSAPTRLKVSAGEILSVRDGILERALPWALSLGVFLVYLSFPTRNYYWDGIDFASVIEHSQGLSRALVHPHHLLYNLFGFIIYRSFDFVGWHVRAVHALQFTNAVLSALSARLLFGFLRSALRAAGLSAVLTLLFSFSATWWKYSTDVDAYVPSLLLLFVCLNLTLAASQPKPWAAALAHAGAMCVHQLAIFFYPAIVLGIFLHGAKLGLRERLLLVLKYSAAASLTTLAVNYYCFHLQTGDYGIAAFANWLTSYLHGPQGYSFGFDLGKNLVLTLRGHVRLFFEGRVNWLEGLLSVPVIALIVILLAIVTFLGWKILRGIGRLVPSAPAVIQREKRLKAVAAVCALWACAYLVFLFFWYPYFTPYRLFYLPALIILLGIVLVRYDIMRGPARLRLAALFVAAMALSNFLFFIYPMSRVEKNPPLVMALRMNDGWQRGTIIYYASPNADNRLFEYFNPATIWRKLGPVPDETFEKDLQEIYNQGGAAWMDASALDVMQSLPGGPRWLSEHTSEDRRAEMVNHAYRIVFVQITPVKHTCTQAPGSLTGVSP